MSTNETQWWAGITCEKTKETTTEHYGNQTKFTTTWKVQNVSFDLSSPEPLAYRHVCPYCGGMFDITVTPRRDISLTREDVEKKFSASIRKRLLQLLLSLLLTASVVPPLLLGETTLMILMVFVSMVGMSMLFYFTVMFFRNIRKKRRFRRDGTIPLLFHMVNPYKVTIVDPSNVHVWRSHRKGEIKSAGSLSFGDVPPPGNVDEIEPFMEVRERI